MAQASDCSKLGGVPRECIEHPRDTKHNYPHEVIMSHCSVNPRCPACNQSPLTSSAIFEFFDRIDQLDRASDLLSQAGAMTNIACCNALDNCTDYQRHCYLVVVDDLIESALGQLEDAMVALRRYGPPRPPLELEPELQAKPEPEPPQA